MGSFFAKFFGRRLRPHREAEHGGSVRRCGPRGQHPEFYKNGDLVGSKYEIHRTLGRGGFGVVYLAFNRETSRLCALKSLHDELLANLAAREAFRKEALIWVSLDDHPNILAARWVHEYAGRMFVEMDYVPADAKGRVHLGHHLAVAGGPLDIKQLLKWSIQCCFGMEHANSRRIECHRDIKPANILIDKDGMAKITDFGLAAAAEAAWRQGNGHADTLVEHDVHLGFGVSLIKTHGNKLCGTPGYMPPEVLRGESWNRQSDVYSFGLVLWQMAAGATAPPFLPPWHDDLDAFLHENYQRQTKSRSPRMAGPLQRIIDICLSPARSERYESFEALHGALASVWQHLTGAHFDHSRVDKAGAWFWTNKAGSLNALGRHEEAIECCDKALAIDPRDVVALNNKGNALIDMGRYEEGATCFGEALSLEPKNATVWTGKGRVLGKLNRHDEAIECCDRALAIDPQNRSALFNKGIYLRSLARPDQAIEWFQKLLAVDPRDAGTWAARGDAMRDLGRWEDAIDSYNKALVIDSQDAVAWTNKGDVLKRLGRRTEAIGCYDKALAGNPRDTVAWNNKGLWLAESGNHKEATSCYDKALTIDRRNAAAWCNKGKSLADLGNHREAIVCYNEALVADPRCSAAWVCKGFSLEDTGKREEAVHCYDNALAIDSRHANAWTAKGDALCALGRHEEAIHCYDKALVTDPQTAAVWVKKGDALHTLCRYAEEIECYDKALAIDPRKTGVLNNKGLALRDLGRHEEAIVCYDKILVIDPQDAGAWNNKALSKYALNHRREAADCYRKFLELAPPRYAAQIAAARQRLRELKAKAM